MKRHLFAIVAIFLAFFIVACAEPEAPRFTVTFEGIEHEPVVVNAGEKFKLPEDLPTRERCNLIIRNGEDVLAPGIEYDITADTVLKCTWEKMKWNLSVDGVTEVVEDGYEYSFEKQKEGFRLESIKVDGDVVKDESSIIINKNTKVDYKWIATATITFDGLDASFIRDVGSIFAIPEDIAAVPDKNMLLMMNGEKRVYRGTELKVTGNMVIDCSMKPMTEGLQFQKVKDVYAVVDFNPSTSFDGTLIIPETYEGSPVSLLSMARFTEDTRKAIREIVFPENRPDICKGTFRMLPELEKISIPEGVKTLGNQAFQECPKLRYVRLADGLESIGNYAFSDCPMLESLELPSSLKTIGDYAFYSSGLKSVSIPSSVEMIGKQAFDFCSDLECIHVDRNPEDCTGWGTSWNGLSPVMYRGQEQKTFTVSFVGGGIDISPVQIKEGARFYLPEKMPEKPGYELCCLLGDREFGKGDSFRVMKDITIECRWIKLFTVSFTGDGVIIPDMTVRADRGFRLPEELPSRPGYDLVIRNGNEKLIPGKPYAIEGDTELKCTWEKMKWNLTVNGVTTVVEDGYEYSFEKQKEGFRLESIKVDGDLVKDESSIIINKNTKVDYKWIATATITFDGLDASFIRDVGSIFTIPSDIAAVQKNHALIMMNGEERVYRGDKLVVNGDITLTCSMPMATDGLQINGSKVTGYTGKENTVYIPEGVTSIAMPGFYEVKNVEKVYLPESLESLVGLAFQNCSDLKEISLPPGLKGLSGTTFMNCKSLASVTFSEGFTNTGSNTFEGCISLTSVKLPESLVSIGNHCFSDCEKLSTIILPGKLETISGSAFKNTALTEITIPASVTETGIQDNVFCGCTNLKEIKVLKKQADCSYWESNWHGATPDHKVTVHYLDGDVVYPETTAKP